jgi:hypothetical protein
MKVDKSNALVTNQIVRPLANFLLAASPLDDMAVVLTHSIDLDAVYPEAVEGSLVVVTDRTDTYLYLVGTAVEAARSGFGLSAKTSRLTLGPKPLTDFDKDVRDAVVHLQGPELQLAALRVTGPVHGHLIQLDKVVEGLAPGRELIFAGKPPRAIVSPEAQGLQLDLPGSKVTLAPGSPVQMTGKVLANQDGSFTWSVRSGGEVGTVSTPPTAFQWAPALDSDPPISEASTLKSMVNPGDGTPTVLELEDDLVNWYDLTSLVINANVAHATHGETKTEVLGSGDAAQRFQTFNLKQAPLTYVSSSDPSGSKTTLEVRVDDVAWRQVRTLYGQGPHDQVYVVRMAADGTVSVEFGDGVTGARLPTGVANVKAVYRAGIGTAGMVAADRIKLLMTRPLGVQAVDNPVKAGVAVDPEQRDSARENAPQQVVTFSRIVSLTDFEDYARAFAGVAKAQADWVWDGESRKVIVTVAGTGGASIDPGSDTFEKLVVSIGSYADPHQRFEVKPYDGHKFVLAASIYLEPGRDGSTVIAAATDAVREAFSFDRRSLGQPVFASDVIAVLQSSPGVLAVDLTTFRAASANPAAKPAVALPSLRARYDSASKATEAAQLLTISDVEHDVALTVAT